MQSEDFSAVIIGTSNSILMNAFTWAFSRATGVRMKNMSLGASCSANAAWAISGVDFSDFNFAIIELSNNEEHQNTHGLTSTGRFKNNLCTLIDTCSKAGAIPIVVSFPRLYYVDRDRPIHESMIALCRKLNVTTLDIYKVIGAAVAMDYTRTPVGKYFMDEAHLKQRVARSIGFELISQLRRIIRSGPILNKEMHETHNRTYYLDASNIDCLHTDLRTTSLISQSVVVLNLESKLSMDFPGSGDKLTAVHLNAARSNAGLTVGGVRVLGRSPESDVTPQKDLISVIRPLKTMLEVNGKTTIEAIAEEGSGTNPKFEICGFVIQRREEETSIRTASRPFMITEVADTLTPSVLQHISLMVAAE